MADNKIIIDVRNNIIGQTTVKGTTNIVNDVKAAGGGKGTNAFSAHFLIGAGRKLISATGNEQIGKIGQIGGQLAKYGMLVSRIIASEGADVAAIVALVTDVAAKTTSAIADQDRKIAAMQNESDKAAIHAGVLDISNTTISINWWSGRYEYKSK